MDKTGPVWRDCDTTSAILTLTVVFLAAGSMKVLTPRLGAAWAMLMGYGSLAAFVLITWSDEDARRLEPLSPGVLPAAAGWGGVLFLAGGTAYVATAALGLETGPPQTDSGLVFLLLPAMVLAAVVEELLFRGRIQDMTERFAPHGAALILQAAIFALYHLSPGQLLAAFVYGIILGLVTRHSGLPTAVGAHMVLNALGWGAFLLSTG